MDRSYSTQRGFMHRFSREKRVGNISLRDFLHIARALNTIAITSLPASTVKVLTCEDRSIYDFSTVTILTDEVDEALGRRKSYQLDEINEAVWERSFKIELYIRNANDLSMIALACDRVKEASKLMFYDQMLPGHISEEIQRLFQKPNLLWKIGDGYSKPSDFNFVYSQMNTRISV